VRARGRHGQLNDHIRSGIDDVGHTGLAFAERDDVTGDHDKPCVDNDVPPHDDYAGDNYYNDGGRHH